MEKIVCFVYRKCNFLFESYKHCNWSSHSLSNVIMISGLYEGSEIIKVNTVKTKMLVWLLCKAVQLFKMGMFIEITYCCYSQGINMFELGMIHLESLLDQFIPNAFSLNHFWHHKRISTGTFLIAAYFVLCSVAVIFHYSKPSHDEAAVNIAQKSEE